MIPKYLKKIIAKDNEIYGKGKIAIEPEYCPSQHYKYLCDSEYYHLLVVLRHHIKAITDYYFGVKQKAKNVDLFMLTPSVSSPMGPGSDSKPVCVKFGRLKTYLVDSSQFGFEPLLMNGMNKVYCYLPSMRGEDPDNRHLNQFYHCEMEMKGQLDDLLPIVESYIKILTETCLLLGNVVKRISGDYHATERCLRELLATKEFTRVTFDKAIEILQKNGKRNMVHVTKHGKDISSQGEIELLKILKARTPVWLTYFDRDRVPFYQKPDPNNKNKTLNADLLFAPIAPDTFGGEVVGAGQRQDRVEEMYESLKRQKNISTKPYEWYIDLRRNPKYKTTSGFGLGIERFIAWAIGKSNIRDVVLYPRLKNVKTCP